MIVLGYNLYAVPHEIGNGAVIPPGSYEIGGKCVPQVIRTEIVCYASAAQCGFPCSLYALDRMPFVRDDIRNPMGFVYCTPLPHQGYKVFLDRYSTHRLTLLFAARVDKQITIVIFV